MMKVCVIIPVHNESGTIAALIEALKKKNLDVVVIDDGSTDNCGTYAREKGAVVITNPVKQGKGLSLRNGFEYALQHPYVGVITLDGDGQHEVADIDSFLEQITRKPVSIITGSRMGNTRGMPLVRYLTNCFMSGLISALCKQRIPDSQCGFRYISSQILKEIQLSAKDFEIETEVLIRASRKGYPIFSLPVKTIYRNEKSKIRPLRDTIRFFNLIIRELYLNKGKH